MADAKLTLYTDANFYSPYAFSSFVALEEKRVPYELQPLSLDAGQHRQGDYPARSITGRVPALQHGDFWLAESSAIDEYLDEAFPPPAHPRLYPEDVRQRARARQLQAWVRSDLMPIREERPTSSVFAKQDVQPLSSGALAAVERLVGAAAALVPADGHLFGAFSVADADLALMLMRLVANRDRVPPQVKAYAERVWARPSIQKWVGLSKKR